LKFGQMVLYNKQASRAKPKAKNNLDR